MSSLQFYLFKPLMRIMRQSQARFPVHDINAFVRFRRRADRLADLMMRPPRGIIVEHGNVNGVSGDWLIPETAPEDPVIVFLHGGGILFTWGSPHRRILGYVSKFAGLRAFGVAAHVAIEVPIGFQFFRDDGVGAKNTPAGKVMPQAFKYDHVRGEEQEGAGEVFVSFCH